MLAGHEVLGSAQIVEFRRLHVRHVLPAHHVPVDMDVQLRAVLDPDLVGTAGDRSVPGNREALGRVVLRVQHHRVPQLPYPLDQVPREGGIVPNAARGPSSPLRSF